MIALIYPALRQLHQQIVSGLDQREIWEWIHDEGELPPAYAVTGKFDISATPWLKEVFRALKSRTVRQVTAMAGVQCIKTLIGELWLAWLIKNDPGATQVVLRDDTEASEHCEERLMPLLRAFRAILDLMPSGEQRGKTKKASIMFPHMWLRVEGAGLGNAQRKSVKNQMCSEIHDAEKWPPGRLKTFASRLTQFVHNSKRYIESQPGMDSRLGIDDMHATYLEGTQELIHAACLSCGKLQPMRWSVIRPDGSRAGIRFDVNERTRRKTQSTDPNLIWNWQEVKNSIRWECEFCGNAHADDDRTRLQLSRRAEFVTSNPGIITHRSFSWHQLIFPNLSWFETQIGGVKNFLIAQAAAKQGMGLQLQEFFQKVCAEPYDPDRFAHMTKMQTVEIVTQPEAKELVVEGVSFIHRIAATDVQAASFWHLSMMFSSRGDEITLWGGELYSWDDVERKCDEFQIEPEDHEVDLSHRREEVIWECSRHGKWKVNPKTGRKEWLSWKALVGSDQKFFAYRPKSGGATVQLPYSWPPQWGKPELGLSPKDPRLAEMRGKRCPIIAWSNPTIKDMVIARRDGQTQGVKILTQRGEWNDEFSRQNHSQRKVYDTGKYGIGKWKWQRFRDDHLLDCRCMATVRAIQKKLIVGGAVPE